MTPFRVHFDNNSKTTDVRVEYENLYLIDQDGERLQALPPFKVEGEAPALKIGPGYAVVEPRWEAEAFEVYNVYDPVFDDEIVVYEGAWDAEPDYYASYYTYWDDIELPTADMLAYALPEGVVKAGGSVDGWVYFEKIEDEGGDIEFRADLVEADSGQRIGQINLPFDVDELEF